MTPINTIYSEMGIRETVLSFGNTIEKDLKKRFEKIDKIAEYNQLKVVKAMQDNRVSAGCFNFWREEYAEEKVKRKIQIFEKNE